MKNELATAIVDGNVAQVRQIINASPELLRSKSESGRGMLELATHKGVTGSVVALLLSEVPGYESYDYKTLITEYISELSYDWTTASWYNGIEHIVWSLLVGDRDSYRFSEDHFPLHFDAEEKAELEFLARKSGGWPTWEGFLSLKEWGNVYELPDDA